MPVRQSYQFSAPSGSNGGLIMGDPVDTKFFNVGNTILRWGIDSDFTNRLRLGGAVSGPGAQSLPVVPYGGFGLVEVFSAGPTINVTPDNAVVRCNTGLNNVTVQLPAANTMTDLVLNVSKTNAPNLVTILPNGAELINGFTSYVLSGLREAVFLRSNGSGWDMLTQVGKINNLLNNYNFSFSTTSGSPTTILTSASTFFTGRPVLFLLSASMSDINGFDEFMIAPQYIQFDGAGTNFLVADWSTNKANDHRHVSGSFLFVPPTSGFIGSHTVSWRTNRGAGAGTLTIDTNDFVSLVSIEL